MATVVIPGSETDGRSTFTVPVGLSEMTYVNDISGYKTIELFVGAKKDASENTFALSHSEGLLATFTPLAPKLVTLNGAVDQDNPLCGATIRNLALLNGKPVVSATKGKTTRNNRVYTLTSFNPVTVLGSEPLRDAANRVATSIVHLQTIPSGIILAAVKSGSGKEFGSAGSGIAQLHITTQERDLTPGEEQAKKEKEKEEEKAALEKTDDEQDSDPEEKTEEKPEPTKNKIKVQVLTEKTIATKNGQQIKQKTTPFDNSLAALKINHDVQMLGDVIDSCWDSSLLRLYVSVRVRSNSKQNAGARAVVVGRFEQGNLVFSPLVPSKAITGTNKIVGARGAETITSISKVRTMRTSTDLKYLVVVGGVENDNSADNQVYALPLVNLAVGATRREQWINNTVHGTLAAVQQKPHTFYNLNGSFNDRAFTKPALEPAQLYTNESMQAMVGGGPTPGSVTTVRIVNDAVIVSVGTTSSDELPGIFISNPIFDSTGKIARWTPWQRLANSKTPTFGAFINPFTGDTVMLVGDHARAVHTVRKTQWGNGYLTNLGLLADEVTPLDEGGLQYVADLGRTTVGFDNLALLAMLGNATVILAETARVKNGIFNTIHGNYIEDSATNNHGALPPIEGSTKAIVMKHGALDALGALTSATVVHNGNNHWLVVGGVGGLALFTQPNGIGWTGNIHSLTDLPSNLHWRQLGDYSFVVKVWSDGNFLYVLTPSTLDRIQVTANSIHRLEKTTLATAEEFGPNTSFADVVVAGDLALLATTRGLMRVGNNRSIKRATTSEQVHWTPVQVPGSLGPVTTLYTVSPTTNPADLVRGGQLLVMSSYIGYNESTVTRFYIKQQGAISNTTVQLVPDLFYKNEPSSFIDFNTFKNSFTAPNGLMYNTHSFDVSGPFAVRIMMLGIKTGTLFSTRQSIPVNIDAPDATVVSGIVTNSASGSLMAYGNFGIRLNE